IDHKDLRYNRVRNKVLKMNDSRWVIARVAVASFC
ncbi:unnamed protein product, partial [Heterotrigona itama]